MKKTLSLIVLIIIALQAFAQAPQAFNYQAIARDSTGNILANQNVSFQISILQDSLNGEAVYTEVQNVLTNQIGVVSFEIGNGNVNSGVFTKINWSNGIYFLHTIRHATKTAEDTATVHNCKTILWFPSMLH